MEIVLYILVFVVAEFIGMIIKRLLFPPKEKKQPPVVKQKMAPPVLIVRIPQLEDEDQQARTVSLLQNQLRNTPYYVLIVTDDTVSGTTFEHPVNFYCDSMKPINYN